MLADYSPKYAIVTMIMETQAAMNPVLAMILTFVAAIAWLRIMDFAAHRGWIESRLSRKLIHIGTGPIFVLCWLLFPGGQYDRYLAALVPGLITVQFALIGLGVVKDEASVKAMSRSGDPREILRGPLYYGVMFVLLTIFFWKDSPVGMVALMMMCGGDGIADLVGRRIRSARLPWSPEKSVAGSLSVLLGGFGLSALILAIYVALGVFPAPFTAYLLPLALIGLVCAAVESLPYKDIDNITVTLSAALLGWWLF
jgi:phytol kinase